MAEIQPHVSAAASERRVEEDGGHREPSLLGQVGEVGGHQGGRRRQGQRCPGLGPRLKAPPRGGVGSSRVVGDAVVQGLADALEVGAGQPAGGGGKVLGIGLRGNGQEGFCKVILASPGRCTKNALCDLPARRGS